VIDAGAGGLVPTTIIDLTASPPEVLREGAGSIEDFIEETPRSLRGMRVAMKELKRELGN
jgi:tRNA A37 threonylcarbamoyladenosine synthetase subunit TsaC/SUA5/YrdC